MSDEPFYIRQTAEPRTVDERREWIKRVCADAKSEGAKDLRVSHDESLILVEGWRARPGPFPRDHGAPRFAYTA